MTLDKLADKVTLIEKIIKSPGRKNQVEEWQEFELLKSKKNIDTNKFNDVKHLYIDTKFFDKDLKSEILLSQDNLDSSIDGVLIKSDNWQALNTILAKYKDRLELIYIDPPFNTGSDFVYKDKYQDSTWLTLMENRLILAKQF